MFVNVPSFSANDDAGRTTSAYFRVESFRKMSCETMNSQRFEALLDVVGVRLGLRRILADQVERLDPAVVQAGDDLVEPVPGLLRHLGPPAPANFARISGSSTGW